MKSIHGAQLIFLHVQYESTRVQHITAYQVQVGSTSNQAQFKLFAVVV